MCTDTSQTIEQMTEQETRLIALMSERPLDVWTALEIVCRFPLTPSHDLTSVADGLLDKGLVLVQRARPFDESAATAGLALTAAGVKVGFELARRRLSSVQEPFLGEETQIRTSRRDSRRRLTVDPVHLRQG